MIDHNLCRYIFYLLVTCLKDAGIENIAFHDNSESKSVIKIFDKLAN